MDAGTTDQRDAPTPQGSSSVTEFSEIAPCHGASQSHGVHGLGERIDSHDPPREDVLVITHHPRRRGVYRGWNDR